MRNWLQMNSNGYQINGFYKVEFGYPVRNLVYEPDSDQPLTPIKGEVLYNGEWIDGRWTNTGQVLCVQFDLRWQLIEIDETEYKSLMQKISEKQLDLFEAVEC